MKSQKWLVFKVFLNSVQIKVSFQFEIIILSSENCNLEKNPWKRISYQTAHWICLIMLTLRSVGIYRL